MSGVDALGRRRAREAALQMLYQIEVGKADADEAIASYWPAREGDEDEALAAPGPAGPMGPLGNDMREFADRLVTGTVSRSEEIDAMLGAHTKNWRVERMAVIDRIVLRLGVYEMLAEAETPSKVIINEALELARSYSGEEAVAFVNGILDAVRKELRRS